MKKIKILSALLALLMLVSVFVACKKDEEPPAEPEPTPVEEPASFADILDVNYKDLEKVPTSFTAVAELQGYSLDFYNFGLACFSKTDSTTTYKLFSFFSGKVVASFTTDATPEHIVSYSISIINPGVFYVTKYVESVPTYYLYDATGKEIIKRNQSFSLSSSGNYFTVGNDAYERNEETGGVTLLGKMPSSMSGFGSITDINDKYFYVRTSTSVSVYDRSLKPVAVWTLPANVTTATSFVLENGNVLIQYQKELHPSTEEYDLYDNTFSAELEKYDLVTEIFSVEDKTSTMLDFNYAFDSGINDTTWTIGNGRKSLEMYNDAMENVIKVRAIVDQKISQADADIDFLAFANNGAVGKSYKLIDNQTGLPVKLAFAGYYSVSTSCGNVIIDANGDVKGYTGVSGTIVGSYSYDQSFIYDAVGNVVYDFTANNAVFVDVIDNTIFVKQYASEKRDDYTMLAFVNGEMKEICKYATTDATHTEFYYSSINAIGVYCLVNNGEYTYYNADGVQMKWYAADGTELTAPKTLFSSQYKYNDTALVVFNNSGENVWYFVK